MVKRFITILILSILLVPMLVVKGDLITEPNNDFFSQHENDCVYLGRSFEVNCAEGFVQILKEPGASGSGSRINNGEIVYIDYSCLFKGEYWGFTLFENGWIKIDGQLLVLYDYIAFEEEHLDDIYDYKGDYAEIKKTKAAVAWQWPGSATPLWVFEDLDTTNFSVLYAYKDEQGREWGFVTYLYRSANIWFCLSDPLNKDIPAFNPAPAPMIWKSDTAHNDIAKSDNSTIVVLIALVAVLAIGTVILIKVLWKPNEAKQEEK